MSLWGFTPALDILAEIESCKNDAIPKVERDLMRNEELNVLLIGPADPRHILKTIGESYKHKDIQLNFYIIDINKELIARQMLLLTIALEPPEKVGLLEKTRYYMEIFGNNLIRPSTALFLRKEANQMIHMVTDSSFMKKRMPLLDVSKMKRRELDQLEDVFKFWRDPNHNFNALKSWDDRLRQHLQTRYDSREGVFDWDFHMRLRPFGGERILSQEFKFWRRTGIAFTWLETESSQSNPTMSSCVVREGYKLLGHCYIGDIVSGPFYAHGISCPDQDMQKKANNLYLKRSCDVTERNLMRLFTELKEKCEYIHNPTTNENLNLGTLIISEENFPGSSGDYTRTGEADQLLETGPKEYYDPILVNNARVIFLGFHDINETLNKDKFKKFFHVIVTSLMFTNVLNEILVSSITDGGLLILENLKFVLGLRKEQLTTIGDKLAVKAKELGLIFRKEFNPISDERATLRLCSFDGTSCEQE